MFQFIQLHARHIFKTQMFVLKNLHVLSSVLCSLCYFFFLWDRARINIMCSHKIISLGVISSKSFKQITVSYLSLCSADLPHSFCHLLKLKELKLADQEYHWAKYRHFSKRKNLGYANFKCTKFLMLLVRPAAAALWTPL